MIEFFTSWVVYASGSHSVHVSESVIGWLKGTKYFDKGNLISSGKTALQINYFAFTMYMYVPPFFPPIEI